MELGRLGNVSADTGDPREQVYCDTFDWRLHGRDLTLVEETCNGKTRLLLAGLHGKRSARRLSASLPEFARQLPPSAFRTALGAVTEPRLLLPVARVLTVPTRISIADMDGQVVARMIVETSRAAPDGSGRGKLLPRRVRVEPVPGEPAMMRTLTAFFQLSLRLMPPGKSFFDEVLSAVGRAPGDYSSKVALSLTAAAPAGESLRLILKSLARSMEQNAEGSCIGKDPEFLHDFRVAVRRTRSALGQLKGILPAEKVAAFRQEFAWLQEVTGPARDMDVYLHSLPGYRKSLPALEARRLGPLKEYLERRGGRARAAVAEALRSRRYQNLMVSWKNGLDEAVTEGPETPFSMVPTADLAAARIWRAYRRVAVAGRKITADTVPGDLHELRKACKKLRYLMEFFRSLFSPKDVERLVAELKKLQDNLGDFNDLEVQSAYLEDVSKVLEAEESGAPRTYIALGRLIEGLHWRSLGEKERFISCFQRFDRSRNRKLFRRLFRRRMPRGFVAGNEGKGRGHGAGD